MFRLVAVVAFIVAIILFVVVAISSSVDPHVVDWGFVSLAAGLLALSLEGLPLKMG